MQILSRVSLLVVSIAFVLAPAYAQPKQVRKAQVTPKAQTAPKLQDGPLLKRADKILNLNPDQREKFRELEANHHKASSRPDLVTPHLELDALLRDKNSKKADVLKRVSLLNEADGARMKERAEFMLAVREILTEEQVRKLPDALFFAAPEWTKKAAERAAAKAEKGKAVEAKPTANAAAAKPSRRGARRQ